MGRIRRLALYVFHVCGGVLCGADACGTACFAFSAQRYCYLSDCRRFLRRLCFGHYPRTTQSNRESTCRRSSTALAFWFTASRISYCVCDEPDLPGTLYTAIAFGICPRHFVRGFVNAIQDGESGIDQRDPALFTILSNEFLLEYTIR